MLHQESCSLSLNSLSYLHTVRFLACFCWVSLEHRQHLLVVGRTLKRPQRLPVFPLLQVVFPPGWLSEGEKSVLSSHCAIPRLVSCSRCCWWLGGLIGYSLAGGTLGLFKEFEANSESLIMFAQRGCLAAASQPTLSPCDYSTVAGGGAVSGASWQQTLCVLFFVLCVAVWI